MGRARLIGKPAEDEHLITFDAIGVILTMSLLIGVCMGFLVVLITLIFNVINNLL